MYNEYFGLKELPFSLAPDPRYLYMSERHREALAHLVYGMKSDGGFVLLTGEVGTGKTTVCRCLLEQIPENTDIAFVFNPKLTVEELLAAVCDEFGVRYPKGNKSIKVFVDLLNEYLLDAHANGRKAVLIIDEAQNLSADVLEQLRLLTNLETNQHKLLQIILLGQPELKNMLARPGLRQLAQRIIARYHLGPLLRKEVAAYVAHRLSVAGLRSQLFPPPTIDKLYHLSGGIPRLINVLCDRALLGAYVQGKGRVDKPTLVKASREVFGGDKAQKHYLTASKWLLALLVLAVVGALITATFNNNNESQLIANITEPSASDTLQEPLDLAQQLDTLQWPIDQPNARSREMAYQALFNQWNITRQPEDNAAACLQAPAHGLRCLNARGSLSSLRRLNRPAVLKFFDDQGQEFYATLTALGEETATLLLGTETREVALKDIASRWFGDYTLLWRVPPGYQGNIHTGNSGPDVQWLDKQLALIQGQKAQPRENITFDDALLRQVKEFQLAGGLVPDGIVGPQTLIHLNTAVGSGIPKLIDKQEDN